MLKEVAHTAIAKIKQAWPDIPIPTTPVGRGRPKKVAPHVPKTNDVLDLFNAVKDCVVS